MEALEFVNLVSRQIGYGRHTDLTALTEEGEDILAITNVVLQAMGHKKVWPQLRKEDRIQIYAPKTSDAYGTGTYGSGTFEIVAPGGDFFSLILDPGRLIQVGSYTPFHRIATVSSQKICTLESVWAGEDFTEEAFTVGQDIYPLPADFDRLLSGSLKNITTNTEVEEVTPTEMKAIKHRDGLKLVEEEPQHFCIYGLSDSGASLIHLDRISDASYNLEFEYQMKHPTLAADDDPILYPDKYMLSLADKVIAMLQRDKENSERAVMAANDALREDLAVGAHPDNSSDKMQLRIQGTPYGAYRRR